MRRAAASALAVTGIAAICLAAAAPAHADTVTSLTVPADQIVDISGDYADSYFGSYPSALPNGPLELPLTIPAGTFLPIGDDSGESDWGGAAFTVPAPIAGCSRDVTAFTMTSTIPFVGSGNGSNGFYTWVYGVNGAGVIDFAEEDVLVSPEQPWVDGEVSYNDDDQPYLLHSIWENNSDSLTYTVRIELPEALPYDQVAGALSLYASANYPFVVDHTFEEISFDVTDTCEEEELAATGADPSTTALMAGAAALFGAAALTATAIRRGARSTRA